VLKERERRLGNDVKNPHSRLEIFHKTLEESNKVLGFPDVAGNGFFQQVVGQD
jgi:hypothetical protein